MKQHGISQYTDIHWRHKMSELSKSILVYISRKAFTQRGCAPADGSGIEEVPWYHIGSIDIWVWVCHSTCLIHLHTNKIFFIGCDGEILSCNTVKSLIFVGFFPVEFVGTLNQRNNSVELRKGLT